MAPKNANIQSSKKETIGSGSKGSAKASIAYDNQSIRVTTRIMTRAAVSITLKQQLVTLTLQSRKTQKIGSNLPVNEVDQTICLPKLKLKPLAIFNMRKTCLLYTSPSPRDGLLSRMPSSA